MTALLSKLDAATYELVGHLYALLRLATLLGAVRRNGDEITLTMSLRSYEDIVAAIHAAGNDTWERLAVPE